MKDLITLVQEYATAYAAAERHHTLLECLIDDPTGQLTATAAEWGEVATVRHARLVTALDTLTRTTVRATPDQRLPVCTWQRNLVEIRAVAADSSRSVRVHYTRAQAVAAGAALIACAAVADSDTGANLTPILPAFPDQPPTARTEPAGDSTAERGVMTPAIDPGEARDESGDDRRFLDGARLAGALALISPLDPLITAVLQHLNLRVYPGRDGLAHRSDYVVLDVHGVSLGVQRRAHDLYLHADTTETSDASIAFEVNGTGEHDHPTR